MEDQKIKQSGKKSTIGIPYYKSLILLFRLLGICTVIVIVIFILPIVVPYIKNAGSFKYIREALKIEKIISLFIQDIIPTKIAGRDMTRWFVIIVAILLSGYYSNARERFRNKISDIRLKNDYETLKAQKHLTDDAEVLIPLKEKLESGKTSTKKGRKELLKLFAETKKKLDSMGRDLAFLAIDVVDSTGMKHNEEKPSVEHDFLEYKYFIEGKLRSNGSLKSAWTPDGVMCCFPTVDAAVRTAREVITGLEAFNKNVKTIKRDFMVRCGINQGYVYFDEAIPLEEISDRVIDIAGHMQKNAPPNKICIAKPAIEPLQERNGFVPAGRVVDGYEVYMWGKT